MTRLVLVHGRDNDGQDPEELEATWRSALRAGMVAAGRARPLEDDDATLVYYGDTLARLAADEPVAPPVRAFVSQDAHPVRREVRPDVPLGARPEPGRAPAAIGLPDDERAFVLEVADEMRRAAGITDAQVYEHAREHARGHASAPGGDGDAVVVPRARSAAGSASSAEPGEGSERADGRRGRPSAGAGDVRAQGAVLGGLADTFTQTAWLAAVLEALDGVPGVSGAVVTLLARDVYRYLVDPDVRAVLDDGLAAALPTDQPAVVVAHSLGSVIAYSVLQEHRDAAAWEVPLLVTVGSPLAVRAIRDAVRRRMPLRVPEAVGRWVDVRDPRDVVALHGLASAAFPLEPAGGVIEELLVENLAPGRHAAAVLVDARHTAGYLAVPDVAATIADALDDGRGATPSSRRWRLER